MNKVLNEDIKEIANSKIVDWKKFEKKNILITGATGLIGSLIVKSFIYRNENFDQCTKLFLLVRNKEGAENIFGQHNNIQLIESDIEDFENISLKEKIDYIIHGASPTKSKYFIEKPVETLDTSVIGTKNILKFAKKKSVKSIVYLSSMEMYGTIDSQNVTESDLGYINPLDVRSSYSEGKRICELYSYSYFKEYNVPIKIARIAQTFGAGISKNENRVYKYFCDCILNKKDIILKSSGKTLVNFSYTTDTVQGILCILLNGDNGNAYNIVSDKNNMTILELAQLLAKEYCNNEINVKVDIDKNSGLAPDNKMILNNEKLKSIGWNCKYTLKEGYERLVNFLIEENNK